MTFISGLTAREILVAAGPLVVGATFVWAGAIKAIAPHNFQEHLSKLGWIPANLVANAVVAAAAFEGGWGTALMLGAAPSLVLPVTALLLVIFTTISWWGVKSGRTTDCGCYGGYVVPSIGQSVMLNGAFTALVLTAWLLGSPFGATQLWKLIAAVATAAAFGGLAIASRNFFYKHGKLMIDMSPLKVGREWRSRWGANLPDDGQELLVSYLGPDCPHCKTWVRVLNAINQSEGLPRVTGVVATSREKLETFIETSGIRFPVTTIPQTLMSRLVLGVPTTTLVSAGSIEKTWSGNMPPDFYERFRRSFFPAAEVPKPTPSANGAASAPSQV